MSDSDQKFHIEYVYGPYVGRRYIEGPTLKAASDDLWLDLQAQTAMWVANRFRIIKELKE